MSYSEPPPSKLDASLQADALIAQFKQKNQQKTLSTTRRQLWIASILSGLFFFYSLIWQGSGEAIFFLFDVAIPLVFIAIGNPWKWLRHRSESDFRPTPGGQFTGWVLLITTIISSYYLPQFLNSTLQSLTQLNQSIQAQDDY